jgi:hypothetical protein
LAIDLTEQLIGTYRFARMSRRRLFDHSRFEDTRRAPDPAHDQAFASHRFCEPLGFVPSSHF